MNGTRAKKMKPRASSREKSAGGREVVRISSCPAFDAYLSANKWPVDEQKSKEMFARLGEQMRDRCEREVRQLAHLSIIKQDAFADHPSLNRMAKRIRHALNFRLKKMAANVSSRKRLRGESEKEKIANLLKDAAIRLFVSKQHLPVYLLNNTDVEFSRRVAAAHVKGVNPLFDHVDWTILFCWDQLSIRFLPGQFVGYAYVEKGVPGLKTWRDAAPRSSSLLWRMTKLYIHEPRDHRRNIQIGGRTAATKRGGRNPICIPTNEL